MASRTIESLLTEMAATQRRLDAAGDVRRHFHGTYTRTTQAVADALREPGFFEDPEWVEEWDVVFADLYLEALAAGEHATGPWRAAFEADVTMHPVAHVLLGMNAHINFDLPQALLAVLPPEVFDDPVRLASRSRDHDRIDEVLLRRIAREDAALEAAGGPARTALDRLLTPVNRAAVGRFLAESRRKVWHNTLSLHSARQTGSAAFEQRLGELERLSTAKIGDLLRRGPVLLRLAVVGFGVRLPETAAAAG
ncbi:MAG: DUF5995 family protein [Actinomycetales bacterium]